MTTISARIAQRFDKLDNWIATNPLLLSGELAIVSAQNQTRFKVGDGVSRFNALPFVDQTQLSTISAYASVVSAGSLAIGYKNEAAQQSLAVGSNISAKAQHSIALGNRAATSSLDSFVFNGDNSYLAQPYYDHGEGTFNVNAPLSDIYIQEKTLEEVLQDTKDETFDAFQWIQMIRPTNENKLHLHVEIYKDSDMLESAIGISAVSADSETSASLFKAFLGAAEANSPSWVQISADGTSPAMAKYPVAFDVKTAIISANLEGFQWDPSEVKWVHYWWYYKDESNLIHPSDIFSMPFPATTEVGANAGEAATLEDLLDLQQEVMPSYKLISQDEYDGYICYSNVYNILSGNFDQSEGHITLKDYSESRRYHIKMHYSDVSALTSNEYVDDEALSVWIGLAGVSQVSPELTEQLVAKLSACQPEATSADIEANLQFERWELYVDGKLADNVALQNYYKKSETSSAAEISNALTSIQIPTDLSDFTNSPGYLTAHQSLSNYYKKTETSSASEIATALGNAGSTVALSAILTTGTPIASISVDGNETTLYAPSAESGSSSSEAPGYKLLSVELSSCTYDGAQCLCCAIENHSTTTISISSDANDIVVFLPPKPADNTSRDFIIRVEISSSTAPGFFFVGAGSESLQYDSGEDDWNVLEPGLNLVSFTETK